MNRENKYERYDGDYEAYNPKYASYSKTSNPHRHVICQKLLEKKWVIISVVLLLPICGIALGLSIHFTAPQPPELNTTLSIASTTITVATTQGMSLSETTGLFTLRIHPG